MNGLGPRLPPGLPAHVATTRHLCAAYPMVAEAGLGHEGVLIGRDVLGGSFVYDPFALYRAGTVTNPNMVVVSVTRYQTAARHGTIPSWASGRIFSWPRLRAAIRRMPSSSNWREVGLQTSHMRPW